MCVWASCYWEPPHKNLPCSNGVSCYYYFTLGIGSQEEIAFQKGLFNPLIFFSNPIYHTCYHKLSKIIIHYGWTRLLCQSVFPSFHRSFQSPTDKSVFCTFAVSIFTLSIWSHSATASYNCDDFWQQGWAKMASTTPHDCVCLCSINRFKRRAVAWGMHFSLAWMADFGI